MFSVLAKNISTALNKGQRRSTMLVVMVAIKPILYKTDELNETECFRYISCVNYITFAVLFASPGMMKNERFIVAENQWVPE